MGQQTLKKGKHLKLNKIIVVIYDNTITVIL